MLKSQHNYPLTKNLKLMLLAQLITNIGNGMHLLVLGKYLYDYTHSVFAFGVGLILDYVFQILLQAIAGSIVDRYNPKHILLITETISCIAVLVSGFFIDTQYAFYLICFSVLAVNMGKPFVRTAWFAFINHAVPKAMMTRYMALSSASMQAGQLLGVSMSGIVITALGISASFFINGLSYLIFVIIVAFTQLPTIEKSLDSITIQPLKKLIGDWLELMRLMRTQKMLFCNICLSSADILGVMFINLSLMPLIVFQFSNNSYLLSVFDASFASGALFLSIIIKRISKKTVTVISMLTLQGCLFISIQFINSVYTMSLIFFLLGISNALSVTLFISSILHRSNRQISGRIAGLKNIIISLLSMIIIPIISYLHTIHIALALSTCGFVLLAAALSTLYIHMNKSLAGPLIDC